MLDGLCVREGDKDCVTLDVPAWLVVPDRLGEVVGDGVSVMLPLCVPLGETVALGLSVDDGDRDVDCVGVSVMLDDRVPDGDCDVDGLDERDAVKLCVTLDVPVVDGESVDDGEPLDDAVTLWVKLGVVVREAVAVVDGVEVGDPDCVSLGVPA